MVVVNGLRMGKTTAAIKQANASGGYIVTFSKEEASRVFNMAKEMGTPIRFPVTFDELINNKMSGSCVRNIIIDNADIFLNYILPSMKIEMITLDQE